MDISSVRELEVTVTRRRRIGVNTASPQEHMLVGCVLSAAERRCPRFRPDSWPACFSALPYTWV